MTTAIDSLAGYADASECAAGYMDFARIGPMLAPTVYARSWAEDIVIHSPERLDDLDSSATRAQKSAAAILGFDAANVTLSPNTSAALFQAAFAMPTGEVVVSPFDFPANTHPWVRAQEHGGARVRWMADVSGPRPSVTPDLVAASMTDATVAVAVSAVDFATGESVDLHGIRDVIGDRMLVVDAIQGLGAVDLPWWEADVVASGGQKWLRGGWGTGVLACSPRALARLGTGLAGWSGAQGNGDPRSLARLAAPRDDVGRFSMTAPDMVAVTGFAAALEAVEAVGVEAIHAHQIALQRRVRLGLAECGAEIVTSDDENRWSGIFAFSVPGLESVRVVDALARAGISVSEREGRVRVSVHASTEESAIDALVTTVTALTAGH